MRRNTKFLLLFAFLVSSALAAYFVSGCGDDSTVIESPDVVVDRVIGTIHGTVSNGWNNTRLENVMVVWSSSGQVEDTTYTTALGYYTTDTGLTSGDYTITFIAPSGYASAVDDAHISTVAEYRGNNPNVPGGNMFEEVTLNMNIYPLTAGLTGRVYEALPTGAPPKDDDKGMALDGFNPIGVAAGIQVTLDFEDFNVLSNKFYATTDATGLYTFTNVPAAANNAAGGDWVTLSTPAFTLGGKSYGATQYGSATNPVNLTSGLSTAMPNIYAPLAGEDQRDLDYAPVVMTYNWQGGDFGIRDTLVMTFSSAMDPSQTTVTFKDGPLAGGVPTGTAVPYTKVWNATYLELKVIPTTPLTTDNTYSVLVAGKSAEGLTLQNNDGSDDFTRNIYTEAGIHYLSSNIWTNLGSGVTDFALAGNIELNFDMAIDTGATGFSVTLTQDPGGADLNVEYTLSLANNNTRLVINPVQNLESNTKYELEFDVYSTLLGDYISEVEAFGVAHVYFWALNTATIPGQVTGFALNMGADWLADYNDTAITFKWASVAGADYYQIYAFDSKSNPNYAVAKDNITHLDYVAMQGGTVSFNTTANGRFDQYNDDEVTNTTGGAFTVFGVSYANGATDMPLVTPFAGGNDITFRVRAVNTAGAGPWSTTVTVGDQTPPSVVLATQAKSADASASDSAYHVGITFNQMEYLQSVTFAFAESGGDPEYVLPTGAVSAIWDNDYRNIACTLTVPAGECATADVMTVTFVDNSGNDSAITYTLTPWIEFTAPVDTTSNYRARTFDLAWTVHQPTAAAGHIPTDNDGAAAELDLYVSYDGGATWTDTLEQWLAAANVNAVYTDDDGTQQFDMATDLTDHYVDTIRTNEAMLGLALHSGGFVYMSDEFTWGGLKYDWTTADSTVWVSGDSSYYDLGGTDSSLIELTINTVGLDSVYITYGNQAAMDNAAADPREKGAFDTLYVTDGDNTYDFWFPIFAAGSRNYDCFIGVYDAADGFGASGAAAADGTPRDSIPFEIAVLHDSVAITTPADGAEIAGGTLNYDIVWSAVGNEETEIYIGYIVGDDTTLIDQVPNAGELQDWDLPANTPSATAKILATTAWPHVDGSGDLLDVTGNFTISGYTITTPAADILVGADYDLVWTAIGTPGNAIIYYSPSGFTAADSVRVTAAGGDAASPFDWTTAVQQTYGATNTHVTPSETAKFRIWGATHTKAYATSNAFAYEGYVVTHPNSDSDLVPGQIFTVKWNTIGDANHAAQTVDIWYTVGNNDDTVEVISNTANTGTYSWTVPNTYSVYDSTIQVRVRQNGHDSSWAQGDSVAMVCIIITEPMNGTTLDNSDLGGTEPVTWEVCGKHYSWAAKNLYFEYYDGSNWNVCIGGNNVAAADKTFDWDISGIAAGDATKIRCRETGGTILYTGQGSFTLQD